MRRFAGAMMVAAGLAAAAGAAEVTVTTTAGGKAETSRVPLEFRDGRATFVLAKEKVAQGATRIELAADFLSAEAGEAGYWLFPNGELGEFSEKGDATRSCFRLPMAFYGLKTPRGAYVAIVRGLPNECAVWVDVKGGRYQLRHVVDDLSFGAYEDLVIDYVRLEGDDANYAGMARAYRNYQLGRGAVKTLKERVKAQPLLDYAVKYPEIRVRNAWKPVPSPKPEQTVKDEPPVKPVITFDRFRQIADEFKRQGIAGAEFCLVGWNVGGHDGRWPQIFPVEPSLGGEQKLKEAIRHAQDLGYQVVAHCNHRDAYLIADSWDAEYVREKNPDGTLRRGKTTWGGGRMYSICPKRAYERFALKDMPMVRAMGFEGLHYLDVFTCVKAEPCHDPRHPLNARQAAEYVGHMMQLARDTFGGSASEGPYDHHIGQVDSILYVSFARPFDAMPKLVTRYVPAFQLVYNGIVLSNPFTTTVNAMIKGRPSELKTVEFGARPSFYYYANFLTPGKRKNWMGDVDLTCDTDADLVKSVSDVKRGIAGYDRRAALQYCFMEGHDELKPGVYRTRYSDGTRIYVNYNAEPAAVDGVTVPAEDWLQVPGAEDAVATLARLRARADERIAAIRATPNREVPASAPKYYVSATGDDAADGRSPAAAWRTVGRLNREKLAPGSYVLFARGGLYRGSVATCPGVTYTAYGEGAKPCLVGSPENGADPAKWERTDNPKVWAYQIGHNDVGALVFDGGAALTTKIVIRTDKKTGRKYNKFTGRPFESYRDLDGDLHFWHDYYKNGTGKVYLYSAENPGKRFKSIEFNVKCSGFRVGGNADVTIDNFTVKHVGVHGVSAGTCRNLRVGNCEFGWIGGSIQAEGIFGRDHPTRLGNAVEIYGGCDGYSVTNCYIWQVYDAGVTHQVNVPNSAGTKRYDQKNVLYKDNVFEKCNYSIEYFLGCPAGNESRMENVLFEGNLAFDAGTGFCEQRPDRNTAAHIKAWFNPTRNRAKNYLIRNNAFCGSKEMLLDVGAGLRNTDGSTSLPRLEGNVLIGRAGDAFGCLSETSGKSLVYGPEIQRLVGARGPGNRCLVLER